MSGKGELAEAGVKKGFNFIKGIFGGGADDAAKALPRVAEGTLDLTDDYAKMVARKAANKLDIFKSGKKLANKFDLPEAIPKRGSQYVDNVADVIGGVVKSPRTAVNILKKLGLATGALGATGALYGALSGGEPSSEYDPSLIKYSPVGNAVDQQSIIDDYIARQTAAINDAYANMPAYNVPGAEMYNPLSAMVNQVGGASIAEMQKLANAAASTGSGIQASGAQGAGAINDIYGGASGQMSDLASYGGEYGAMTPVSGAMATAPAEAQMQGQNLADYLQQNQMISSQDAGFLAGLAPMLGSGYANELAMMDYAARSEAAIRQQQLQQEMAYGTEREKRQALLELALGGQDMGMKLALEEAMNPRPTIADPALVKQLAAQYNKFDKQEKQLLEQYKIKTVEDYINYYLARQNGE